MKLPLLAAALVAASGCSTLGSDGLVSARLVSDSHGGNATATRTLLVEVENHASHHIRVGALVAWLPQPDRPDFNVSLPPDRARFPSDFIDARETMQVPFLAGWPGDVERAVLAWHCPSDVKRGSCSGTIELALDDT